MYQPDSPLYATPLLPMLFLSLLLAVFLTGCTTDPATKLAGKWQMHQVIQEGKDVSAEHNPYGERYIVLETDQDYTSDGRPFGANTGKYTYDEYEGRLFLDSDVGPEDDSYWLVALGQDSMRWQGTGSAWAEDFEIVFVRGE